MGHVGFVKKFKLLKEVVGCFLFSLCLIFSLLVLDHRILNTQFSVLNNWLKPEDEKSCDIFEGKWVWDESYPLYQPQHCMFMESGVRCTESGRTDKLYTKWRWQPKHCDLPRFDVKTMLERLRNRRLVFVGDSLGRNQWESILCMLSSAVPDKTSVYEVNGNPVSKSSGSLEYYKVPFLVLQSRAPAGAPEEARLTLKLDQMDWSSAIWKDADVLVLNAGHWWSYGKTIRVGCYFQDGAEIKTEMSVEEAFRRSIQTLSNWISREVNVSKTHLIFRSFSPVHFRGGDRNTGGACHLETLPDLKTQPTDTSGTRPLWMACRSI